MSPPERVPYGYGGWSKVARFLTLATGRPVSRQLVRSWWLARERNGFPELQVIFTEGREVKVLSLELTLLWYKDHNS